MAIISKIKPVSDQRLRISYAGGRPITIRGVVTGIDYCFSGVQRVQDVDPRDAVAILRSSYFRMEGLPG